MTWQLADAKNKLSEVVRLALEKGPQRITRRGEAVVVVSAREFDELARKSKKKNFIEFLLSAPSFDGVNLERDKSPMRKVRF
ncbi:MAG TPA: type II toxin-antitoxin system Phd/YefM family antitoxin [Micropepsaceae bacterium]|nr:type II toxin-antitoxin system Phd/YefM family antitoxin [Micropepsaceae bacterium]